MKNYEILIVEDEAAIALDIEMRLVTLGYQVMGIAPYPSKAIELLDGKCPDLVLMDINLKGSDEGIELAEEIMVRWRVPVVFLTAHSDLHTFKKALTINPYGYVSKPFKDDDLRNTIELALHNHTNSIVVPVKANSQNDSIFVKDGSGLIQLKFAEIRWIRAYDTYCKVYLNDNEYVVNLLLKEFDQKLPADFIRVHRSFIVSASHITKITTDTILIDKQEIPIGKAYKESLLKFLNI
ncbi:LytR/AlgR family response regulator transcription factor [Ekhidna sp.]|uniref:LytR/AlgR family response regulator transcription factor n=1 Tax=Ekhidna sp. TaxID=2608089 RepID=UPI0035172B85